MSLRSDSPLESAPVQEFQTYPGFPGVLRIAPSIALDAGTVFLLHAQWDARIPDSDAGKLSKNPPPFFLVDFSRVDDMDPAGIGFLVAVQKRLRAQQGDLVLCSMRPKLARLLESTGFSDFFSVAVDTRYALEYIQGMGRGRFPVTTTCPACSGTIGIDSPGRGRCSFCDAVITASPDGTVQAG